MSLNIDVEVLTQAPGYKRTLLHRQGELWSLSSSTPPENIKLQTCCEYRAVNTSISLLSEGSGVLS